MEVKFIIAVQTVASQVSWLTMPLMVSMGQNLGISTKVALVWGFHQELKWCSSHLMVLMMQVGVCFHSGTFALTCQLMFSVWRIAGFPQRSQSVSFDLHSKVVCYYLCCIKESNRPALFNEGGRHNSMKVIGDGHWEPSWRMATISMCYSFSLYSLDFHAL